MIARIRPKSFYLYYVYALFDECGVVRYIGKGKGDRWLQHETERSKNRIKNKFVKRTIAALGEIPKIKIRENLSEAEAFTVEVALIAAIGRIDLNTGPLTNMSDGGLGGDLGHLVRQTKANWTPEERAKHSETYRQATKQFWAQLPTQEKEIRRKQLISRFGIARKLAAENPEHERQRKENIRKGHLKRTPEQKAASHQKWLENFSPIKLSKAVSKFHASQTPEERSRRVKGNLTPEQLSERARRAAAKRDRQENSDQVRRQQANLTEEQKIRRVARARALGTGTKWINNGIVNKRLKNDQELPSGWVYGKIPALKKITQSKSELESATNTSDPTLPSGTAQT